MFYTSTNILHAFRSRLLLFLDSIPGASSYADYAGVSRGTSIMDVSLSAVHLINNMAAAGKTNVSGQNVVLMELVGAIEDQDAD